MYYLKISTFYLRKIIISLVMSQLQKQEFKVELAKDPRVIRAMKNLRAMGLDAKLVPISDNEVSIFISLGSIVRLIESRIAYPNKFLKITSVDNKDYLVIDLWR
jgi:hypothetical protein